MKHFYAIIYDHGDRAFVPYDIIPYLVEQYKKAKKSRRPKSHDEFVEFVDDWCKYRYWSRCEYEIIVSCWPGQDVEDKIDIYQQVKPNIDTVALLLEQSI